MAQPLDIFVNHTMVGCTLGHFFAEVVARVAGFGEARYCDALVQDIDNALVKKCRRLESEERSIGRAWILCEKFPQRSYWACTLTCSCQDYLHLSMLNIGFVLL